METVAVKRGISGWAAVSTGAVLYVAFGVVSVLGLTHRFEMWLYLACLATPLVGVWRAREPLQRVFVGVTGLMVLAVMTGLRLFLVK